MTKKLNGRWKRYTGCFSFVETEIKLMCAACMSIQKASVLFKGLRTLHTKQQTFLYKNCCQNRCAYMNLLKKFLQMWKKLYLPKVYCSRLVTTPNNLIHCLFSRGQARKKIFLEEIFKYPNDFCIIFSAHSFELEWSCLRSFSMTVMNFLIYSISVAIR